MTEKTKTFQKRRGRSRGLALGIDAGGTYTDIILLDQTTGHIISRHKSPTTRPDPSTGIKSGLDGLNNPDFDSVEMVSLATTFATNAIVEETGAEAGLILIGYEKTPEIIPKGTRVLHLKGGHSVKGDEQEPLDLETLDKKLKSFVKGLQTVAIAGFFSIRNPEHEDLVTAKIKSFCDLPVIQGHRLSMRLDAIKRAATVWLNARLIPIIRNLIRSCQKVLADYKIQAPLMVVRSDGTLMSAHMAVERPIDTLLSGPAASILGAKHLAGVDECLIVDMGGTTTDIAILSNGRVKISSQKGARVGKWETHVEAAQVRTIGLGGDSLIHVEKRRNLRVGPRRVIPLCVQADKDERIIHHLTSVLERIRYVPCKGANPCSFFIQNSPRKSGSPELISEYNLWIKNDGLFVYNLIEQETKGLYFRTALTPTDLRVARGEFCLGNPEASRLALRIFAEYMEMSEEALSLMVNDHIQQKLCLETVAFVSGKDKEFFNGLGPRWYNASNNGRQARIDLDLQVTLTAPVVGLGAPAHSCMPHAFEHINTDTLLPEGYDVSVAVGSVIGMVDKTYKGLIRANGSNTFDLFTPKARKNCNSLEEAVALGRTIMEDLARDEMRQNYVGDPLIKFNFYEQCLSGEEEDIHLETELFLRATGRPNVSIPEGLMTQ
ncbi:MAG: hydantoinase/oxoprolinase family protein [Desulfobacteraceae bacterium]|nr:hydantoinase/oxoprolinase family protein [Desulfobacteraceae bacterium]MBC2756381.1 hydantoinase/oxoprolinase family protein [Desulfobacteraceae bacterium]